MATFELMPPEPERAGTGVIASLVLHLALLAPFVVSARPTEDVQDPIDQLVVFLVPPDRPGGARSTGQPAHWSDATGSEGVTEAPASKTESPDALPAGEVGDPEPEDSLMPGRMLNTETALTEIEVDSVVERDPTSAAPKYPEALLARNVEGSTFVHYVVDTSGRVDTMTIRVVRSTAPEFAVSVREALGQMKFRPAVQASRKVRQWVEQNFAFKIVRPSADTT